MKVVGRKRYEHFLLEEIFHFSMNDIDVTFISLYIGLTAK